MTDSERRTADAPGESNDPAGAIGPTPPPPAAAPRRLTRSKDDRVIAGVCGGLGRYVGVDPVLVRIAALLLIFAGGAGLVLYVIGWVAMTEEPVALGTVQLDSSRPPDDGERRAGASVLGIVFVAIGAVFLVDAVWADVLSWRYVWPIALIAVGAAILLRPRT